MSCSVKSLVSTFAFCCVCTLQIQSVSAQQFYSVGSLVNNDPLQASSRAWGVSADGNTVVGSSNSFVNGVGYTSQAYRWTRHGGMTGLGFLAFNDPESFALGVSGNGNFIVGMSANGAGQIESFRWTSGGGMVGLGHLPGYNSSGGQGISSDGTTIVGTSLIDSGAGGTQAYRWSNVGGMVGLGWLPGGNLESSANAVSANGQVVVGYSSSGAAGGGSEAFRWTSGGGMQGLGDLPGGTFFSNAFGVSADGSVIVGQSRSASGFEAFRWTANDGMIGLGDFPGGIFSSVAYATSADGSVIVGRGVTASGQRAFLWTEADGMQSIEQLLINGGVNLSGWELRSAHSISADGLVIAGIGVQYYNGQPVFKGWVADFRSIPEPSSGMLAGLLLTAAWMGRWRRHVCR